MCSALSARRFQPPERILVDCVDCARSGAERAAASEGEHKQDTRYTHGTHTVQLRSRSISSRTQPTIALTPHGKPSKPSKRPKHSTPATATVAALHPAVGKLSTSRSLGHHRQSRRTRTLIRSCRGPSTAHCTLHTARCTRHNLCLVQCLKPFRRFFGVWLGRGS